MEHFLYNQTKRFDFERTKLFLSGDVVHYSNSISIMLLNGVLLIFITNYNAINAQQKNFWEKCPHLYQRDWKLCVHN